MDPARSLFPGRVRLLAAVGAIAAAPGLREYLTTPHLSGDTFLMVEQMNNAIFAIEAGQWSGWGGHFALLQQIPALLFSFESLDSAAVQVSLAYLNLLLFAMLLWWSWVTLRRRSVPLAVIFVIVLVAGPLPWYAHASFGEMLAALVTLGFVIACIEDASHIRVVAFMVLAGLSKDLALPFVVLVGLAASAIVENEARVRSPSRERLVALATGAVISAAVTLSFNYLRYGGPFDPTQLMPLYHVPTHAIQASFFLAIWASPNGGMITFWPALAAFLVFCAAAARRAAVQTHGSRVRTLTPAVVIAVALFGLTLGFSEWYSPLGWITWGPRLMLPWVPACALLLAVAYAPEADTLLQRLGARSRATMAILLLLSAATLPQFVILARPTLWDPLWAPDNPCPRVEDIEKGADYYYRCTIHQMWTKPSVLLDAYDPGVDPSSFTFGIVCCLAVAVISWRALTLPLLRWPRRSSTQG